MKKDSEDLVIVCRTIGFKQGWVLPACLSFASAGPACAGPFVGLEWGAGLFRDERRSGNQAGDFELFEAPSDAKAAGAGFVGDFQDASG